MCLKVGRCDVRKLVIAVLVIFLFSLLSFCGQEAKLSPVLRMVLAESSEEEDLSRYSSSMQVFGPNGPIVFPIESDGEKGEELGVLVKVRYPFFGSSFLGFPVAVSTGTILGMKVSLASLLTLIASPDVVYVEPAWKTQPKLDVSVPIIKADVVHAPPISDMGEGVIIGAVDTGIDYMHLDFRYDSDGDGLEESSRILWIWDQTSGLFSDYYDRSDVESDIANGFGGESGIVRQSDSSGHGTHVIAAAAGDGSSSSAAMIGVAPQAKIVVVKTAFYTSDILSGVRYIFDKAEEIGLPAVVNLSLGGQDGPHDGTSLFEQGLDELIDRPGRAIVVSAGNEGDLPLHVARSLAGNEFTFLVDPESDSVEISIWYPGTSNFKIVITPPMGDSLAVATGTIGRDASRDGIIVVDNAFTGPNPNNQDNEARVALSEITSREPWAITVRDDSGGGRFDGWVTSNNGSIIGGDSLLTIDEPGNANTVITVGSFNTKAKWMSVAGEQDFSSSTQIGRLSYFSSLGPTRDGRQKPDIVAPGAWICSAQSSDAGYALYLLNPDGTHVMNLGTSMAAPHVAGVIALMFSENPELTSDEIRLALTTTATRDAFTGSMANNSWGYGKVNASDAVEIVAGQIIPSVDDLPVVELAENPVSNQAVFLYSLPDDTTQACLQVITVAGTKVLDAELSVYDTTYSWDLIDEVGRALANGLYLYVLGTDKGNSAVGRLVISR
jgi:subtilisin family serine protease